MVIKKKALRWAFFILIILVILSVGPIIIFATKKVDRSTLILSFGVGIGTSILIGFSLLYFWRRNAKESAEKDVAEQGDDDSVELESGLPRKFSFKELESATANFHNDKKLGKGGFGPVFEGNLIDGTQIAVKRLDPLVGSQGRKEFLAEVKTIGSIHHLNLVRLLGYCTEKSHKLLVYEYMCNGSLDKWIFHPKQDLIFDWQTRRKIIIDIAKGLSYLHEECQQRIVHLDIKPQNILLDGQFNAKLSDFGLARFIDRDQSEVLTGMRGTRGYLAPEWFSNRRISEKADVYSFGVVVLEVMSGRKNLHNSDSEEYESLLQLVGKKAKEDQLFDVIDRQSEDMQLHREDAVKMVRTAAWCLQGDSTRRPSMSMVVKVLEDGMDMENVLDFNFLTLTPIELLKESNESGSAPLLASILSAPR